MKKSILGLLMFMLLVPVFSFASTTVPTTITSEQTQVDQRQELMLQLISLLRTYITQLQQRLTFNSVSGTPVVLGIATSTVSNLKQTETLKKRRGGGGGGGSSNSSQSAYETKETACRLAADLRFVPGETKLAYYTEQGNQPVYAGWAPDTTKELYNYLVAYINNYITTGNEFFTHIPDYQLYYALQHVRVLETRFSHYIQNKTACGEEVINATDVLVPLTPEILALTIDDSATSTDAYDATLTFGLSDNNPDETILNVETNKNSYYYNLLSLNIEANGGEVEIKKAVVRIDVPHEVIGEVVNNIRLNIGGRTYRAEPYGLLADGLSEIGPDGSYAWYVFDLNNEAGINENEKMQINVEVEFKAQEGAYPRFQAIIARVDEETRSLWKSVGYNELNPNLDYSGLSLGKTHKLTPPGLLISELNQNTSLLGESGSVGVFKFDFKVTALGDDFFVSSVIGESGSVGVVFHIEGPEGFNATTTAVISSTAGEDVPGVLAFQEGNTENINVVISLAPSITGTYQVILDDVFYAGNNQGTPAVGSLSEQEQISSDQLVIFNVNS